MRQREIIISLLLACLLVLCCAPAAFAATDTPIDLQSAENAVSGEGWQWNAETKCLTLCGLQYADDSQAYTAAILLPGDSTIILQDGTKNEIVTARICAIECAGTLTIQGDGELHIKKMKNKRAQESQTSHWMKDYLYASCGIMVNGEGDCVVRSGSVYMTEIELGIFFTALGGYQQDGGTVEIDGITDGKSQGIFVGFGTVNINDGTLLIKTSDFGISCMAAAVNGGTVKVLHQGEEKLGRAGIYVGSPLDLGMGLSFSGLVGDFVANNGSLYVDGWINGVFIVDGGNFRQNGGSVKITNNLQYGIGVLGSEIRQGDFQITGGTLETTGGVSAVLVLVVKEFSKDSKYVRVENADIENTYNQFTCYGNVEEGEKIGLAGFVAVAEKDKIVEYADYLYGTDDVFLKQVQIECKTDEIEKASKSITCYYNDQLIIIKEDDGEIYIDNNGRTMVPLRILAENMNFTVTWDATDKSITIENGPKGTVVFYAGSKVYNINGTHYNMDTMAVSLPPGRTYVPLRYVAESLGAQVNASSMSDGMRINIYK